MKMHNYKFLFTFNFLLLTFYFSSAQQNIRLLPCNAPPSCQRNTIYHETNTNLGNFNYNSLNFEHLLNCSPTSTVGFSLGVIYYSFPKISSWGVPLNINFMFGRYSNLFEVGFGATYMNVYKNYEKTLGKYDDNVSYAGLNAHIGLRHQNTEGGFFYRVGFTPMLSILNYEEIPIIKDKILIPMAGVSIGWTFK
jgi:hypothetical protein